MILPSRGRTASSLAVLLGGSAIAIGIASAAVLPTYWLFNLTSTYTLAVILCSVVLLVGYVGQPSLAQATFAGIGAFSAAKLDTWGVPVPLAILGATAVALPIGAVVGIPALRVRGLQLALVTIAFAVFADEVIFQWNWLTGLSGGGVTVSRPEWMASDAAYYLITFACLVAVLACMALLRRSKRGRRWSAIAQDERGALAIGVDVATEKLLAFAMSASIAALGGALFAYNVGGVNAVSFNTFLSLNYLAIVGLVGLPFALASPLAAAWLVLVPEAIRGTSLEQVDKLVVGLGLIVVMGRAPDGLLGAVSQRFRTRAARLPQLSPVPTALEPAPTPHAAEDARVPAESVRG